jgi:hypothetical protein
MTNDQRKIYLKNKYLALSPHGVTALPKSLALPKVGVI